MKIVSLFIILLLLSACVTTQNYRQINGGARMHQPGISFIPPTNKLWSILAQDTYRTTLATRGDENESIITAISIFNIPVQKSKESFMKFINNERNKEPKTGRFEVINNSLSLDKERSEICVKHNSSSKDFGAKRDNKYTLFETYGMYCIHPSKPNIGVFIELSRKAPMGIKNKSFNSFGEQLLKSVTFKDFKV